MTDLAQQKSQLRQQALLARQQGGNAEQLSAHLYGVLLPQPAGVIAGYWPIRDEADPRPALLRLNRPLCLPAVIKAGQPLEFRHWDGTADGLEAGAYGTAHPGADQRVEIPKIVIVPLAGFDRQGGRLGYGGGFYDRSLERLRASGPVLAIGLAYGVQELPLVPVEPTDQALDLIVTDREIIQP